jgi:hypothetical protein
MGYVRRLFRWSVERRLRRENAKLSAELLDTRAELEAERRALRVAEAEIESLAAVVARDRARVKAETAVYARKLADAEGNKPR